jgi:hypothetical protein
MKKFILPVIGFAIFTFLVFRFSSNIEYVYQSENGAFVKIVDEDADGTANKVYTQQCFGGVPGCIWYVSKPTKEDQELFFRSRILAMR